MTLYFHSWQYLVRGWLYRDIIYLLLTIFREGMIILWHFIFTTDNISWEGDYIVTWNSHPWQYLVRGWLYRDITFSLLAIFGQGGIISWHYIFTPRQYLVRGWLYLDIFSLLKIFREEVIISWHYIFNPDNIWWGGDYIVTLEYHFWHYPRIWH